MQVSAGVEGQWRTIRIADADPDQRAALAELGFGPDLVRRYPPGTRHFDRAVANLGQRLDEMVRQKMTGAAPGWAGALGDLVDRAGQAQVPVAVVGSVSLAVRGVDVRPGDVDVITTVQGADALGDSYRDVLVVPVADEPGFGIWGRAFTGGICVEWLGVPDHVQQGPWPLDAAKWSMASPFEEIRWQSRTLRVPPLQLQRQIEARRQRLDRIAAIDAYCTTLRLPVYGTSLGKPVPYTHDAVRTAPPECPKPTIADSVRA